jgi:hypothetical protein
MTAFTAAHGILGIEGIHVWNGVELNRQLSDAGAVRWPLVRFNRITGLLGLPEADDNRAPATGRIGEIVYPGFPRGRTITYEGTVYGRDLLELRGAVASLRGTFSERSAQGMMVVKPHPTVGGAQFYYYARPIAFDIDDEQVVGYESMPSAWQRGFILSLRQADPRYWHSVQKNSGSQGPGATPTVTNDGNAPTDFGITVEGPISDDFVIERYGNPDARKLLLNNVSVGGGDHLAINMGARSIRRMSDNADLTGKLVFEESDWWNEGVWGLHPGNTVIRCAGGGNWFCVFNSASW